MIGLESITNLRNSTLERVGVVAATLYLCALPFNHSAALRSVTLLVAVLSALCLWWRAGRPRPPLFGIFLIWFVAAGVSLFWTKDVAASVNAIWHDVIRSAFVLFAFYIIAWRGSATLAMALGSLAGWIALATLAVTSYLKSAAWVADVLPSVGNYAIELATVVPLFLICAFMLAQRAAMRWIAAAVAVVSLALLATGFLTHNRAMWIGLAGNVLVGGAVWLWRSRDTVRPWHVLSVPLVAAAAIGVGAVAAAEKGRTLTYFEDRAVIYGTVLDKIESNPWFGTGYGHETDQTWYLETFAKTPVGPIPTTHSHNIVLSFADQLGVLGLLVLFAIFGSILRELYVAGRTGSRLGIAVAATAIGMVVSVFVMNNFNMFFVRQHLWLFFAHVGIYLGLLRALRGGYSP